MNTHSTRAIQLSILIGSIVVLAYGVAVSGAHSTLTRKLPMI